MKRKSKWGIKILLILVSLSATLSMQAQTTVSGTVKNSKGEPLVGVSVFIKGTTTGEFTDMDGKFSLKSNVGATLVVSYIGYKSQEVNVNSRTNLQIVLEEERETLDEVVVVGYGTQRKSSLTASVSQIGGKELLVTPSTNISSILGGRIPGVTSVQESGQPGADDANLVIRGSKSGALYIVDGIPRTINEINPNDIETVSVLKDASATAVYGINGAGGVVIITTKKGAEGTTKVNYEGSFGISRNANFPEFLDGPGFAWYYNKGLEMDGNKPIFTKEHVNSMLNDNSEDGWGNTNWIDKVFGTGYNQRHSVTLQGGTDKVKYFTSLGYLNQQGNIDNFSFSRYNLRSNIEAKVAKDFTVTVGIAGFLGNKKNPAFSAGGGEGSDKDGGQWMSIARQTIASHPYLPETFQGLPTATPNRMGQPSSPLAAINESGLYKLDDMSIQTNISLKWDLPWVKGLSAKVTGAYDFGSNTSKNLGTPYNVMLAKLPSASGLDNISYDKVLDVRGTSDNTLGEGYSRTTKLLGQAGLNYQTEINKVHKIDILALAEIRQSKSNRFAAYGKNMDFIELPELDFTKPADSPISGSSDASRSVGFVTRVRYDYMNRYLFEFSSRYDGSYKFAGNVPGKRWGFFPSVSLGWRMTEEDFMKKFEFINNLKIRGSVGLSGVDGSSTYAFLSNYTYGDPRVPISLGGIRTNTMYTNYIANKNLTWEIVRTQNIGFDFSMWKGLLGMEFDMFYNYNYDILGTQEGNYPPSMGGYYYSVVNKDRIDTKGLEILVTHNNTLGQGKGAIRYGIEANLTWARSRWLTYSDSPNIPDYQKVVGSTYGLKSGWVADGLFQSEEDINASPWPFGERPRPGDIKYKDLNGDGIVDWKDRGLFGRSNRPELMGGLKFYGSWRGFDANVLFTGAAVLDVSLTGTYYNSNDDNTIFTQTFKEGGNSPRYLVENAWRPDNTGGTYPRLTVNDPHNNNGLASTFWFRDGKYIRLKSAQLGYTIPATITKKAGIEKLRVFVEGSNLFTLSGLPQGIDPESPGVNNGYYPQQKTFMGGVSLTF